MKKYVIIDSHTNRIFDTEAEARQAFDKWTEAVYNEQKSVAGVTDVDYLQKWADEETNKRDADSLDVQVRLYVIDDTRVSPNSLGERGDTDKTLDKDGFKRLDTYEITAAEDMLDYVREVWGDENGDLYEVELAQRRKRGEDV